MEGSRERKGFKEKEMRQRQEGGLNMCPLREEWNNITMSVRRTESCNSTPMKKFHAFFF